MQDDSKELRDVAAAAESGGLRTVSLHRGVRRVLLAVVWLCVGLVLAGAAALWQSKRSSNGLEPNVLQVRLARFLSGPRVAQMRWPARLFENYSQGRFYRGADVQLPPHTVGSGNPRVVLFGDSITQNWASKFPEEFFPGKQYIGRGIGGQTSLQMIWRFKQDVLDLHPDVVVLLAGTNDILKEVQHHNLKEQGTRDNIQAMVQMAREHGSRVILCTVPPETRYGPALDGPFKDELLKTNQWLQQYAAEQHLPLIDYYSVLATRDGEMPAELSLDRLHPNLAGYKIMRPLAQQAIDSVLASAAPSGAVRPPR